MPIIEANTPKFQGKCMIFGFSHFWSERFIDDLKKTFNKSQIICREKISEISQSTSCQYQSIKSQKFHVYVHNWSEIRENYTKMIDFMISYFGYPLQSQKCPLHTHNWGKTGDNPTKMCNFTIFTFWLNIKSQK